MLKDGELCVRLLIYTLPLVIFIAQRSLGYIFIPLLLTFSKNFLPLPCFNGNMTHAEITVSLSRWTDALEEIVSISTDTEDFARLCMVSSYQGSKHV